MIQMDERPPKGYSDPEESEKAAATVSLWPSCGLILAAVELWKHWDAGIEDRLCSIGIGMIESLLLFCIATIIHIAMTASKPFGKHSEVIIFFVVVACMVLFAIFG